jgi:hypothetical protein
MRPEIEKIINNGLMKDTKEKASELKERIRELEQLSVNDQQKIQKQAREINRLREQHREEIDEDAYQEMVTERARIMNQKSS